MRQLEFRVVFTEPGTVTIAMASVTARVDDDGIKIA
jgi:hypothetical protein